MDRAKNQFLKSNIQHALRHAPRYANSHLWFHVNFKLNELLIENENFCVGPLWKSVAWERCFFFFFFSAWEERCHKREIGKNNICQWFEPICVFLQPCNSPNNL